MSPSQTSLRLGRLLVVRESIASFEKGEFDQFKIDGLAARAQASYSSRAPFRQLSIILLHQFLRETKHD